MPSFDRLALIEATERALQQHEAEWKTAHAGKVADYEQAKAVWFTAQAPRWSAFADTIRRKLRKNLPVLTADLPNPDGHRFEMPVFRDSDPTLETWKAPPGLGALLEVLRVLTDEKVTPAALRDLGVPPDTLRRALSYFRSA